MDGLRFGVLIHQDAPFAELATRWRTAEDAGLDAAYVCDHTNDYRHLAGYWLDGWTVLAAVAGATSRIRIGPLVTNPILRPPVSVAKTAVAVDELSGGRLDLGVGTGIAAFDHAAAGVPYWPPKERADRFREYVEVLDGLLRSADEPFSYTGRYHRTGPSSLVPGPVQRPRPPLVLAGQSRTVRRVAAERADVWNTHGPYGRGVDEILDVTARQNAEIDRWCTEAGRDPTALRRSLLLFDVLDPWASPDALPRLVERFAAVGMTEFIACWPEAGDRRKVFDAFVTDVLPGLRG